MSGGVVDVGARRGAGARELVHAADSASSCALSTATCAARSRAFAALTCSVRVPVFVCSSSADAVLARARAASISSGRAPVSSFLQIRLRLIERGLRHELLRVEIAGLEYDERLPRLRDVALAHEDLLHATAGARADLDRCAPSGRCRTILTAAARGRGDTRRR